MILPKEILMKREKEFPLMVEEKNNLMILITRLNKLAKMYGKPMIVSSGYRPEHYNTDVGGAKDSAHLYCMAVDFKDPNHDLVKFCTKGILDKCDLYMEDPKDTPAWCHLQIRKASARIFKK